MEFTEQQIERAFVEFVCEKLSTVDLAQLEIAAQAVNHRLRRWAEQMVKIFDEVRPKLEAALAKAEVAAVSVVEHWENQPASPGIEPLLISNRVDPITSRFLAHAIAKLSRDAAKLLRLRSQVIAGIRRISTARNVGLACRKAKPVFLDFQVAQLEEEVFRQHDVSLEEFLTQFRLAGDGDRNAQSRVREMAQLLAPQLKNLPGRKPTAASIAREYMASFGASFVEFRKYTYNQYEERFSDPITLALVKEFNAPSFDPRPACRRAAKKSSSR